MNDDERYLFDLNGFLVLRGVLSAEEVATMNAAIDHHDADLNERDGSLVGESKADSEAGPPSPSNPYASQLIEPFTPPAMA